MQSTVAHLVELDTDLRNLASTATVRHRENHVIRMDMLEYSKIKLTCALAQCPPLFTPEIRSFRADRTGALRQQVIDARVTKLDRNAEVTKLKVEMFERKRQYLAVVPRQLRMIQTELAELQADKINVGSIPVSQRTTCVVFF